VLPTRINLVTLGVADVGQSRAFYESLGFAASGFESSDVAFFDMNGTVLGLYGQAALAEDAGVSEDGINDDGSRFRNPRLTTHWRLRKAAGGVSCSRRGMCSGVAIRDILPIRMVISGRSRTIR